jgi:hypothetical protein
MTTRPADRSRTRIGETLPAAFVEFLRHPSPWLIVATLTGAIVARVAVGDWQIRDLLIPVILFIAFPFIEWGIHVALLHWKPRRVAGLEIDPLVSRKHREHHVDPRIISLIFVPWQVLTWLLPALVLIGVFAFRSVGLAFGLTFTVTALSFLMVYEWIHYLIHTDYKPKYAPYRAVWRNHRHHHFKNEHYWFTVTSSGTADRVLNTYPDPQETRTSKTARNLHALNGVG